MTPEIQASRPGRRPPPPARQPAARAPKERRHVPQIRGVARPPNETLLIKCFGSEAGRIALFTLVLGQFSGVKKCAPSQTMLQCAGPSCHRVPGAYCIIFTHDIDDTRARRECRRARTARQVLGSGCRHRTGDGGRQQLTLGLECP
ncbi:hypothetical protein EVAR_102221_1 [Eumeta japonica]|uniref:Uncharacterized protein n=1 Tax=Eumeta variegata TaxID=151549 RepID=A0A4C1WD16_EUMVA|nr:hypothetical protein EVAR_102221_1 [Eumeta japonica]